MTTIIAREGRKGERQMATTKDKIAKLLNSNLSLRQQRDILDFCSYSDAFPTSPQAQSARMYREALAAFDADHPDVVADIEAEQEARRAAEKAELAGKDLLGL